jgi:hypothetical protein
MPVKVESVSNVDWQSDVSGMHADGMLRLSEVSLAQVSEDDLMGKIDGSDPPADVEFSISVLRYPRCADDTPQAQKFTPASLPEYDTAGLQWIMFISDAHNPISKKAATGVPKPKLRM